MKYIFIILFVLLTSKCFCSDLYENYNNLILQGHISEIKRLTEESKSCFSLKNYEEMSFHIYMSEMLITQFK